MTVVNKQINRGNNFIHNSREVARLLGPVMLNPSLKCMLGRPYKKRSSEKKPFPSSPGPLYQNKVKCSAFDMEMVFHSHANKTLFHKKGCAFGLILKERGVFGTWKKPIEESIEVVIAERRSRKEYTPTYPTPPPHKLPIMKRN